VKYQVYLTANGIREQHVLVVLEADDMHVEIAGGESESSPISINVTKTNDEGDVITVGIFPFAEVAYAIAVES